MHSRLRMVIDEVNFMAEVFARVDLTTYNLHSICLPPKVKEYKEGRPYAYLGLSATSQFKSIEEAFSILFKKYLYHCEEWKDDNGKDITKEEWVKSLKETWIPSYFKRNYFIDLSMDKFLPRFKEEILSLGIDASFYCQYIEKIMDISIVELDRSTIDLSYDVFAFNQDVCFYYSWWITY